MTAQDCKLNAVTDMVQSFASTVENTSRLGPDTPEEDALHAVAALYQSRANSAPLWESGLVPLCLVCPGTHLEWDHSRCTKITPLALRR